MGLLDFLKRKENAIYLNKLKKKVKKVLALEEEMQILSNEQLQAKTEEFKSRLKNGETLNDLLYEAFAVVREAAMRVLNMKHYPVQIIGGIALHEGNISEMSTGEGKTLVATLPAYLNALTGDGVHIVTVNEYLAKRDYELMSPLYRFLGLTTAVITENMKKPDKKEAYLADVVYVTNSEVGFDYLRDNMVMTIEDKVQRKLNYCIIDEVDSVLLDDARTPLIISGQGDEPSKRYYLADMFARIVKRNEDFKVDEESRSVMLTDKGIDKVEKMFRIDNYTDPKHSDIRFFVEKALNAHYMMKRDKDYIIHNNQILIIDESTGRVSEGRRYSDGLHQALEAKEGVKIQKENQTLATITYQNFFLLYDKLSGMTGTASTDSEEFRDIYNLNVIKIPTNKPVIRKDLPDKLYLTESAKNKAIVQDVRSCYEKGQPVLIGTASIEKSESLSQLLKEANIPHVVLNAKNHEKEASIVAKAGQKGAVTIATNMAGRGTDIKLGEGVKELGGLKVIGTERASNRRIDNQLIGRSGRQGDPGESQFYLSFDDDLLRVFTSDHIKRRVALLANNDDSPIEMNLLIRSIHSAQERLTGSHFEARKQTIEYDSINNEQRSVIYKQRNQLLEEDFDILSLLEEMTIDMLDEQLDDIIFKLEMEDEEEESIVKDLQRFLLDVGVNNVEIREEITKAKINEIKAHFRKIAKEKVETIQSLELERNFKLMMIRTVDSVWKEHINHLDYLKDSVRFAGYKETKPIDEYSKLAYDAFNEAMKKIKHTMAHKVLQVEKEANVSQVS